MTVVVVVCDSVQELIEFLEAQHPMPRRRPPLPRGHVAMTPDLLEEVAWLAESAEPLAGAAQRLGYRTPCALKRALYRAGRGDLVHALNGRRRPAAT